MFGQIEPMVDGVVGVVSDGPVGHAETHVGPERLEVGGGDSVEDGVEGFAGGSVVGAGAVNAEAEGDEVESAITPAGTVPVDETGDLVVGGEQVARVEVQVHSIISLF